MNNIIDKWFDHDNIRKLDKQLDGVIDLFCMQLEAIEKIAQSMNINPIELKQSNGEFVLAPILIGLAQALNAKAHLLTNNQ